MASISIPPPSSTALRTGRPNLPPLDVIIPPPRYRPLNAAAILAAAQRTPASTSTTRVSHPTPNVPQTLANGDETPGTPLPPYSRWPIPNVPAPPYSRAPDPLLSSPPPTSLPEMEGSRVVHSQIRNPTASELRSWAQGRDTLHGPSSEDQLTCQELVRKRPAAWSEIAKDSKWTRVKRFLSR